MGTGRVGACLLIHRTRQSNGYSTTREMLFAMAWTGGS
jgi:hypothetical protein